MQAFSKRGLARPVLAMFAAFVSIVLVTLMASSEFGDGRNSQVVIADLPTAQETETLSPRAFDSAQLAITHRHPFGSGDTTRSDVGPIRIFIGQVVERGSRAPIAAAIRLGESQSTSAPGSGRFSLSIKGNKPDHLVVSHPGFEPLVVEVGAGDSLASTTKLGTLELAPVGRARIRVLGDNQLPVAGARCELRPPADRVMYGDPKEELVTEPPLNIGLSGENGVIEFPVGRRAVLWVTAPDGRIGCTSVLAGSDITIRLSGPRRQISVVDMNTRRPVSAQSFPFSIRRTGAMTVSWLLADSEGDMDAPCGPCDLTMDLERGLTVDSVRLNGQEVNSFSLETNRIAGRLSASDTQIEVRVQVDSNILHVVDSSSGLPVTDFAWIGRMFGNRRGEERAGMMPNPPYSIIEGRLDAPKWFVESVGYSAGSSRILSVPGYRVELFNAGVDLRGTTIGLTPSPAKNIQFTIGADRPYSGRAIVSVREGPAYTVTTTNDGAAGPIPWQEGDEWDIRLPSGDTSMFLSSTEIAEKETVIVRLASKSGSLLVEATPEGAPPLFAYSAKLGWIPLVLDTTTALASDVPLGRYRVGTRAWIEQCETATPTSGLGPTEAAAPQVMADQILVKVDQVTKVSWDARWWAQEPTRGRIVCSDIRPSELVILPVAGELHGFLSTNEMTPWRSLDNDGWFELQADSARPSGIVVARISSSGWRGTQAQILDVFPIRADNTYRVNCTSIQLDVDRHLSGDVPDKALVLVIVNDQERSAPTRGDAQTSFLWNTRTPLRRTGLPATAERIIIRGRGFEMISLDLEGGSDNAFDVVFD